MNSYSRQTHTLILHSKYEKTKRRFYLKFKLSIYGLSARVDLEVNLIQFIALISNTEDLCVCFLSAKFTFHHFPLWNEMCLLIHCLWQV
jgi:hypothetical protein